MSGVSGLPFNEINQCVGCVKRKPAAAILEKFTQYILFFDRGSQITRVGD